MEGSSKAVATAILLGSALIAGAIFASSRCGSGRYQLARLDDSNVAVVDTASGQVWTRFNNLRASSGPSDWTRFFDAAKDAR